MGLIFDQTPFKSLFLAQWSRYVPAVLTYAAKKGVASQLINLDKSGKCA